MKPEQSQSERRWTNVDAGSDFKASSLGQVEVLSHEGIQERCCWVEYRLRPPDPSVVVTRAQSHGPRSCAQCVKLVILYYSLDPVSGQTLLPRTLLPVVKRLAADTVDRFVSGSVPRTSVYGDGFEGPVWPSSLGQPAKVRTRWALCIFCLMISRWKMRCISGLRLQPNALH